MSLGPTFPAAAGNAPAARVPAARVPAANVPAAARAVLPALAEASRRTGVAFEALFSTARLESGFNPDARARTSSAMGLFQFIDSTWLNTVSRHGARHGLTPASRDEALNLRRDPLAASLMAASHMADNARHLQAQLGRPADTVDLYLAHFLGAGGAVRFLERLSAAPDSAASELLPDAARANRSIFFAGGSPRSLREVHDLFARRLGAAGPPDAAVLGGALRSAAVNDGAAGSDGAAGDGGARNSRTQSAAVLPVGVSALLPTDTPGRHGAQAAMVARIAYLMLADLGG
jgi:hypothetical protein